MATPDYGIKPDRKALLAALKEASAAIATGMQIAHAAGRSYELTTLRVAYANAITAIAKAEGK